MPSIITLQRFGLFSTGYIASIVLIDEKGSCSDQLARLRPGDGSLSIPSDLTAREAEIAHDCSLQIVVLEAKRGLRVVIKRAASTDAIAAPRYPTFLTLVRLDIPKSRTSRAGTRAGDAE
ncbi:unnamed protein product, partial [Rhizoctonia solani]